MGRDRGPSSPSCAALTGAVASAITRQPAALLPADLYAMLRSLTHGHTFDVALTHGLRRDVVLVGEDAALNDSRLPDLFAIASPAVPPRLGAGHRPLDPTTSAGDAADAWHPGNHGDRSCRRRPPHRHRQARSTRSTA